MAEMLPERPGSGQESPLYRTWVMLLNGYGYNWYRQENRMRADDLLVRSRASEHLADAAARLRELAAGYRRKYLPPPTREHPDPDPLHIAAVQRFRAVEERILEIDTRIRGAAAPPDDRIWRRHRNELNTLQRLGECDVLVVGGATELAGLVAGLPAGTTIDAAAEQQIDRQLDQLAAALTQRSQILAALP